MLPMRYHRSRISRIARSQQVKLNSSRVAYVALSNLYCREKTQPHFYCYIYGIAKQVAVYGGLKLGLEWNVRLSACTYGYIIKDITLYMHSFQEALSLINRARYRRFRLRYKVKLISTSIFARLNLYKIACTRNLVTEVRNTCCAHNVEQGNIRTQALGQESPEFHCYQAVHPI